MQTRFVQRFAPCALVLWAAAAIGCGASTETPETATSSADALSRTPTIPAELAVPAGNRLAFKLHAEGSQIYVCAATATGGYAWTLKAPDASLYDRFGELRVVHYAGPTWESVDDGSTVVGTKLAGVTVDATAIPWLLLQGTSHAGKGVMTKITYVQRLETTAGLAPTTGCDATNVNALYDSAYTASYYFYEAVPSCHAHA